MTSPKRRVTMSTSDDDSDVTPCESHTMTSLDHDDAIEIISSYGDSTPITDTACTMFTSVEVTSVDMELPSFSSQKDSLADDRINVLSRERCKTPPPPPSKKQKRIKRAVAIVGTLLILMSLILVAVTLYMSDHIDQMGKCNIGVSCSTIDNLNPH